MKAYNAGATAIIRGNAVKLNGVYTDPLTGRIFPQFVAATAADSGIQSVDLFIAMETIPAVSLGEISHNDVLYPFDCTLLGAVGSDVFMSDTGTLSPSGGTIQIRVGEVVAAGSGGAVKISTAVAQTSIPGSDGIVPAGRMAASVNPTANDIICTIGGVQFKAVASLGAAAAFVQVLIAGTPAATYASLVKAINGTSAPAEWVEATTPFAAPVVADLVTSTVLRVRLASKRGGTPIVGTSSSIALLAAVTGGATAWNIGNLNEMGGAINSRDGAGSIVLSTAMIADLANGIFVELPFTPTSVLWMIQDTNGGGRWTVTDRLTISGNALKLASNGATHVVATDVLIFRAQ